MKPPIQSYFPLMLFFNIFIGPSAFSQQSGTVTLTNEISATFSMGWEVPSFYTSIFGIIPIRKYPPYKACVENKKLDLTVGHSEFTAPSTTEITNSICCFETESPAVYIEICFNNQNQVVYAYYKQSEPGAWPWEFEAP